MSETVEVKNETSLLNWKPTPITWNIPVTTVSVKIERNTKGYNCEVSVSDAPNGNEAVSIALKTLDSLEGELAKRTGKEE